MAAPRLLYIVTEDWYFLSHRLPMARAAQQAGYEVHVATRLKDGAASILKEGFVPHALEWSRGSLSPLGSLSALGIHIANTVPPPGASSHRIRPRCASTICCVSDSPNPVPRSFVV